MMQNAKGSLGRDCTTFIVSYWCEARDMLVSNRGSLHYAGRAGAGMNVAELKCLAGVLALLHVRRMLVAQAPPRDSRFGSPLQFSRVQTPLLCVRVPSTAARAASSAL
jgi:hypothetical protein